jgi:hypothetical protein
VAKGRHAPEHDRTVLIGVLIVVAAMGFGVLFYFVWAGW